MTCDTFSKQALETFGLPVSQDQYNRFQVYVHLLHSWTDRVRLISTHDRDHIWERHILDCLSIVSSLPNNGVVLDLGSGSGLPGVPIKIMRSDLNVVLLEPTRMKVLFLQQVIEKMHLPGLKCIRERAENIAYDPKHRSHYHAVVARAVGPLSVLWELSKPLLNSEGKFIGMKGPDSLLEFKGNVPKDISTNEQSYFLPFIERRRFIVTLSKTDQTEGNEHNTLHEKRVKSDI
jgi:16S rRNA (guanine527-N7)-methyltransferase